MRGSSRRALGMASIPQVCSVQLRTGDSSSPECANPCQTHDIACCKCAVELHMAGGDRLWALPPNTECSNCRP
eukprot:2158164-Amphidinium_carterae.1